MNNYYKFIKPEKLQPREPKLAIGEEAIPAIKWLVKQTPEIVHYDLETTGLNFADPNKVITNVGIATPDFLVGIDLLDVPANLLGQLWEWLGEQNLGGFNLGFDIGWPWRTAREDGKVDQNIQDKKIVCDTVLWFRVLATESYHKQSYSLETLIDTVLGWPKEYLQKAWLSDMLTRHNIKKSDMWKLALKEPEGYTRYCALDAEASYQAQGLFERTLDRWKFHGLKKHHDNVLTGCIKRNAIAASEGIPVDRDRMLRNIEWVKERLLQLEARALGHDKMAPYIEEYENAKLRKKHKLNYSLKKHWAKKEDEPWKYPEIYRVHYVQDEEKRKKLPAWCRPFGGKFYKPETVFSISKQKEEWPRFNVNATADMKWLIYDKWLDGKYDVWYRNPEKKHYGGLVTVYIDNKDYQVELTDTGGLPTGGDILTLFGDIGQILNEYKTLKKLLGDFLEKYYLASTRTGAVHAQVKILGTATGRASGGSQ